MGSIYDLVGSNELITVEEQVSVEQAARTMTEHNVGAVPVLRSGKLVGIFSERDIMNRVVAEGRDVRSTLVGQVMSTDVQTVNRDESLENCMALMKTHSVRHLPIVNGTELIGMVSLRDILLQEVNEMDGEVRAMRSYIQNAS
jgi:CBS domain-containing protein